MGNYLSDNFLKSHSNDACFYYRMNPNLCLNIYYHIFLRILCGSNVQRIILRVNIYMSHAKRNTYQFPFLSIGCLSF